MHVCWIANLMFKKKLIWLFRVIMIFILSDVKHLLKHYYALSWKVCWFWLHPVRPTIINVCIEFLEKTKFNSYLQFVLRLLSFIAFDLACFMNIKYTVVIINTIRRVGFFSSTHIKDALKYQVAILFEHRYPCIQLYFALTLIEHLHTRLYI